MTSTSRKASKSCPSLPTIFSKIGQLRFLPYRCQYRKQRNNLTIPYLAVIFSSCLVAAVRMTMKRKAVHCIRLLSLFLRGCLLTAHRPILCFRTWRHDQEWRYELLVVISIVTAKLCPLIPLPAQATLNPLPLSYLQGKVSWNFGKWLIGKDGKVLKRFTPTELPSAVRTVLSVYWYAITLLAVHITLFSIVQMEPDILAALKTET